MFSVHLRDFCWGLSKVNGAGFGLRILTLLEFYHVGVYSISFGCTLVWGCRKVKLQCHLPCDMSHDLLHDSSLPISIRIFLDWAVTDAPVLYSIHPDWHVWPQFVSDGMQTAFTLDSLRSSHPIEVPVFDALDVDQIFDHISYLKGSSVIRMLAAHLSQETFLKGVSNYLKAHAYGNAKTVDLWSALSQASGQDVPALMNNWITKIGFPVLTVSEEPGQINIKQTRYLSTGDIKPEEDITTWWIPLGLDGKSGTSEITPIAFTKKAEVIRDVDDSFYKINKDNAVCIFLSLFPPI
jgi:hypothetical protein